MQSGAAFSRCGNYRYALWRRWSEAPPVLFVMLNPSTADASQDDPTIRRCIGFAQRWGHGGILVGNLFALRSPDPQRLRSVSDPVGPQKSAGSGVCQGRARGWSAPGATTAHCSDEPKPWPRAFPACCAWG